MATANQISEQTEWIPEQPQYTFRSDPEASDQTCGHCKTRDAEMAFSIFIPEDFTEDGYCCTVCAMAMVTELSSVERQIKIETSDGRYGVIQTGPDEDNHIA